MLNIPHSIPFMLFLNTPFLYSLGLCSKTPSRHLKPPIVLNAIYIYILPLTLPHSIRVNISFHILCHFRLFYAFPSLLRHCFYILRILWSKLRVIKHKHCDITIAHLITKMVSNRLLFIVGTNACVNNLREEGFVWLTISMGSVSGWISPVLWAWGETEQLGSRSLL
jgi:hypothetical protein